MRDQKTLLDYIGNVECNAYMQLLNIAKVFFLDQIKTSLVRLTFKFLIRMVLFDKIYVVQSVMPLCIYPWILKLKL